MSATPSRRISRRAATLGVSVAWTAPAAIDDVLSALVGGAASPCEAVDVEASDVAFDVVAIDEPLPYRAPEGSRWSFHHDHIVAYERGGAFTLQDDASEIVVPADGGAITARIHPRTVADGRSLRTFFDVVLTLALRHHGVFHLHAGGVAQGTTSILFAGESGAGKTSTTLALVEAGWSYLSDDSLFVRAHGDAASTPLRAAPVSFRRPFHLTPGTLAAYPHLGALAVPSPMEPTKVWVAPNLAFPGRFRDAAPPASVLFFPLVTDAATSVTTPVDDADAFGRLLLASTLLSVPGSPNVRPHLALLQALVEGAACYELRLGADFLNARASAVRNVLEPLVARARSRTPV